MIRWHAGCNTIGGSVEITSEQLDVGKVASTGIGCPKPLTEQDEWVTDFFTSGPHWELD